MSSTVRHHPLARRRPAAAAWAVLKVVLGWPARVAEARRAMALLGAMNDHELKDIGLQRNDLRDATGLGLGDDPTFFLAHRARARRVRSVAPRGRA